ncbi:hypothetical protein [Undibacterium danionis]|uniref:DUF4148 domain-containing protein n=1 Tax=Undibacterium danionis TaxID=1812100 RepID=A0ABV6IF42_9BURK
MKTLSLLALLLLSNYSQNALAQTAAPHDKKTSVIVDAEIKRGPLADFYELVAQHPAHNSSTINPISKETTKETINPTSNTANQIKSPAPDAKPILAQQSAQITATKPNTD